MNMAIEMIRRVFQIIIGIFIFDCPGLMAIRNLVYKCILNNFGKGNVFSSKILFYVPHGLRKSLITIGNKVRISENVTIDCSAPVTVEDNVWISQNTVLLNHEHIINGRESKSSKAVRVTEGITLKEDCWIGANVIILPQVTYIGKGAIVGAGSVVTKNVEDYAVVAGNPAKQISSR